MSRVDNKTMSRLSRFPFKHTKSIAPAGPAPAATPHSLDLKDLRRQLRKQGEANGGVIRFDDAGDLARVDTKAGSPAARFFAACLLKTLNEMEMDQEARGQRGRDNPVIRATHSLKWLVNGAKFEDTPEFRKAVTTLLEVSGEIKPRKSARPTHEPVRPVRAESLAASGGHSSTAAQIDLSELVPLMAHEARRERLRNMNETELSRELPGRSLQDDLALADSLATSIQRDPGSGSDYLDKGVLKDALMHLARDNQSGLRELAERLLRETAVPLYLPDLVFDELAVVAAGWWLDSAQ